MISRSTGKGKSETLKLKVFAYRTTMSSIDGKQDGNNQDTRMERRMQLKSSTVVAEEALLPYVTRDQYHSQ